MHYAIEIPQRKRDPARGNEDRADDVTGLQRGAHKGALLLRMGKALAPGYRRP